MKNITVTVSDQVYRAARIKAAELDTSVSALVRDFLASLSDGKSDFDRRRRLQDEVLATIDSFSASDRLSRAEIHERDALP